MFIGRIINHLIEIINQIFGGGSHETNCINGFIDCGVNFFWGGVAEPSYAEAREVFVGTFGMSDVYIFTESINIRNRNPLEFSCQTHWIGTRNKNVNSYHNLNFFARNGYIYGSTDGSSAYNVDTYDWSRAIYLLIRNNL